MRLPEVTEMIWEAATSYYLTERTHAVLEVLPAPLVDAAAGVTLQRGLVDTWTQGWMPYDVFQYVRRKYDDTAASLLVDSIAAENLTYAQSTVHHRWRQQLDELGATVWWDPDTPHLTQWATARSLTRPEANKYAIGLLRMIRRLQRLPQLVPPPGSAQSSRPVSGGVDHKVLARVRGLLAKAESTQFPEEADALSAKAQELMNRHAFDRALLNVSAHVAEAAESRRLWLDKPYLGAKSQLVNVVAHANRCRTVYYAHAGFLCLVGDALDLEITELLSTSLLVQATKAMVVDNPIPSRVKSYRQAFLVAYASRIGQRLRAAVPAEEKSLVPVLTQRTEVVNALYDNLFPNLGKGRRASVSNSAGWGAGRAAADRANLTVDRAAIR